MTITTGALSASELRYRRLFEAAHDGILIIDPGTRQIIDVNPFLEDFLGYSREDLLGRELYEIGLMKDEAANKAAFRELLLHGSIRYDDLPLQTKDGRSVAVEFVSNIYREGDEQVIQCNVRDITARKATENALRTADLQLARHAAELEELVKNRTAELQVSNRQLETFVYSIAHDLRAPLHSMQGFAELLLREHSANLTPKGRDYARYIDQAAQTMDHLLTDLLAFSRVSQQKIVLKAVPLALAVQDALAGCEPEIRAGQARILTVPPWPVVLAHEATLRQVLVNLIGNAVKFSSSNQSEVRLWAEDRTDGIIRVWVEDNGIGIHPEFQERIFQLFQRLHTTAYTGTGIGLAIVQKGIERMGGRVGVISAPGKGSRFWIELTRAPAATVIARPAPVPPC